MARLRDARPKNASGAYERLFGGPQLGTLISKIQGTVIRSGTELERLVSTRVPGIHDLDAFLAQEVMEEGVFLASIPNDRN